MQRETAKEKAPGRGKAARAKKATRENTKQANGSGAAAQARLVLLGNGYLPIPIVGKQSFLKDWATITPTEDVIRGWEQTQAEPGTGILTRTTPAINIDIMDEATAHAIEDFTRDYFKGQPGRLLCRVWQAPKCAWLFRTDAPFAKMQAWFTPPGGGKPQRISILGEGCMLTVEAQHPDTGKPCAWPDGDPWTVPTAELIVLTHASASAWLNGVTDLLVARDWRRNLTQVRLAILANGYDPIPLRIGCDSLSGA
jgi:hypothetical protein